MGTIKVDLTNKYGKFKMLNATNGGSYIQAPRGGPMAHEYNRVQGCKNSVFEESRFKRDSGIRRTLRARYKRDFSEFRRG